MSILDNLQEERTGLRYQSDFGSPAVTSHECEPTGNVRDYEPSHNEEYVLCAKVSITFWANKAQYPDARRHAEKVLLNRLYGDTLALIDEAKKGVYDGNGRTVMAALDKIRDKLLGVER